VLSIKNSWPRKGCREGVVGTLSSNWTIAPVQEEPLNANLLHLRLSCHVVLSRRAAFVLCFCFSLPQHHPTRVFAL